MKEDFKIVREVLGVKLVKIVSYDGLNIVNMNKIDDLKLFYETLNPSIVLCITETIDEKIAKLIPDVIENNKSLGSYLSFLQNKVSHEGHSSSNDSDTRERYFELYDVLTDKLINAKRDEEVCFYELLFPVNGVFLTAGGVEQDWIKYSDLISKHQKEFINNH